MDSVVPPSYYPMRPKGVLFPVLRPILPLPLKTRHAIEDTEMIHSMPSSPGTPPRPSNFTAAAASPVVFSMAPWSSATNGQADYTKKLKRRRRSLPFSYSVMITQAILSSMNHQMTLRDIYFWISTRYPNLYSDSETGWQACLYRYSVINEAIKINTFTFS
jgi:Forkhead domain